jgi:hypothetical protein
MARDLAVICNALMVAAVPLAGLETSTGSPN